jgi:mannobiose 2-epimerase
MLDHTIDNGWDHELGGLFYSGYYFEDSGQCTIIKDTKTWWPQAEALNTLLIFSRIFPGTERYRAFFEKQWEYIDKYLLDHRNGDWYEGGLDKEPHLVNGPKGHIWKSTYHTGRTLMNCIALLSDDKNLEQGICKRKRELEKFINNWKGVADCS